MYAAASFSLFNIGIKFMLSQNFEYGFLAEGLNALRQACDAETVFLVACEAHEGITSKTELYLSMYWFPAEFIQALKETGTTARYAGACWSPILRFDIDRAGDWAAAVRDAEKLVRYLVETFKLRAENVQIWLSGMKGFHIGVPIAIFGEAAVASERFAAECKAVAMEIARRANVEIDESVYDKVKLFRCPNTRHGESKLYKIPVSFLELTEEENAN